MDLLCLVSSGLGVIFTSETGERGQASVNDAPSRCVGTQMVFCAQVLSALSSRQPAVGEASVLCLNDAFDKSPKKDKLTFCVVLT